MKFIAASAAIIAAAAITVFATPASAATGPFSIQQTYGGHYALDAPNLNNYTTFVQGSPPGRSMFWNQSGTYHGYSAGYWKTLNGKFMAAANNCGSVVIKPSSSSNGTVWAFKFSGGNLYLVNKYCDGAPFGAGYGDVSLTGHNRAGSQWYLCGLPLSCSGDYRAISIIAK